MSAHLTLQARVEQYLAERRHAGFALKSMGHGLARFASWGSLSLITFMKDATDPVLKIIRWRRCWNDMAPTLSSLILAVS